MLFALYTSGPYMSGPLLLRECTKSTQTETIAPTRKSFWVRDRPSVLRSAEVAAGTAPENPFSLPADSDDGGNP
jgi:hypothetical protein